MTYLSGKRKKRTHFMNSFIHIQHHTNYFVFNGFVLHMSLLLRILLLMFVETWIYSMLFHLLCSLDSPPRIVSGITQRIVFCVTRSFYDDQSLLSTWLHVFFLHPTQAFLAIHINCFEPSEPFNTRSFKSPKALWIA